MDIKIRKIKREDIEQVVNIQIEGWRTSYKGIINDEYLNNMNKEKKIKQRENDYTKGGFIIAEIDNKVVGFCRYLDNNKYSSNYEEIDCELVALYVDSNLKQKGIGKELFKYVKKEFRAMGKKKMILWCLKENYTARAFYEKMRGNLYKTKKLLIGNEEYDEISYIYDI